MTVEVAHLQQVVYSIAFIMNALEKDSPCLLIVLGQDELFVIGGVKGRQTIPISLSNPVCRPLNKLVRYPIRLDFR